MLSPAKKQMQHWQLGSAEVTPNETPHLGEGERDRTARWERRKRRIGFGDVLLVWCVTEKYHHRSNLPHQSDCSHPSYMEKYIDPPPPSAKFHTNGVMLEKFRVPLINVLYTALFRCLQTTLQNPSSGSTPSPNSSLLPNRLNTAGSGSLQRSTR